MNKQYPKVGVGIIVAKELKGKKYIMLHQRRSAMGKGYWGSGGGHLKLGESLKKGALRELAEEPGDDVIVKDVEFLGVNNFTELQPKHYVDVSFIAKWVSGEPINSSPKETTDWHWFPINNLPKPLFPPLNDYINALQTGQIFFDSEFV